MYFCTHRHVDINRRYFELIRDQGTAHCDIKSERKKSASKKKFISVILFFTKQRRGPETIMKEISSVCGDSNHGFQVAQSCQAK